MTSTKTEIQQDDEVVYFHSGSGSHYRKVKSSGNSFTSIPTIDFTNIDSPDIEVRKALAREIYAACTTSGFFYASNHGISEETQEAIFATMKRFFDLDLETKMDAHAHKNPAMRGYEPMLETQLDPRTKGDIKEAFSIGDCPLEPEQSYSTKTSVPPPTTRPQNIWPPSTPWFRENMYAYYTAFYPFAMKLVHLFALALNLPENAFDKDFTFPIWGLRALHYPPTEDAGEGAENGLGAHADFSWITLVLQDEVGGLEVLNQDGKWIEARPKEGTFVVNVGQYLERQTSSLFPATVHRVRNKTKTNQHRYSIPFFLSPNPQAVIPVLPSCVEEGATAPEPTHVGDLYIRRVLPARKKHPTSIKWRDVPESEWKYEILYGEVDVDVD